MNDTLGRPKGPTVVHVHDEIGGHFVPEGIGDSDRDRIVPRGGIVVQGLANGRAGGTVAERPGVRVGSEPAGRNGRKGNGLLGGIRVRTGEQTHSQRMDRERDEVVPPGRIVDPDPGREIPSERVRVGGRRAGSGRLIPKVPREGVRGQPSLGGRGEVDHERGGSVEGARRGIREERKTERR